MTYKADIFLGQKWRDHRLLFPKKTSKDYYLIENDWLDEIWYPHCYIKNAKSMTLQEMMIPDYYSSLYVN